MTEYLAILFIEYLATLFIEYLAILFIEYLAISFIEYLAILFNSSHHQQCCTNAICLSAFILRMMIREQFQSVKVSHRQ